MEEAYTHIVCWLIRYHDAVHLSRRRVPNGFLLRHEYFLYSFDATLMFLVMVLFLWVHPSELIPSRLRDQLTCLDITLSDTAKP